MRTPAPVKGLSCRPAPELCCWLHLCKTAGTQHMVHLVAVQRALHQLGHLREDGSLARSRAEDMVEGEGLPLASFWVLHLRQGSLKGI